MKEKLLAWLVPSRWVDWLNGRKRLLGMIQLTLWVLIYAIPAMRPEWMWLASIGGKIQVFLNGAGLDLGNELLASGTGFTVVGLVDWVLNHFPSKFTSGALKAVEAPIKKLSNGN